MWLSGSTDPDVSARGYTLDVGVGLGETNDTLS